MASAPSATAARQELEKAKTLPIAEARESALGLARTQPLAAVEPPAAQPRRIRPVAPLPARPAAPVAEVKPIAPAPIAAVKPITPIAAAKPVAPIAAVKPVAEAAKPVAQVITIHPRPASAANVQVSPPAVAAPILPGSAVDDGWSQGRKRSREPARALRPLKIAEGTQPGMTKVATRAPAPKAAGKHAVASRPTTPAMKAVPAGAHGVFFEGPPRGVIPRDGVSVSGGDRSGGERSKLAEGSIAPPPATGKPLPSLFSVIDRKKPEPQSAAPPSRLPGLPPPPPARPSIGSKKAVSTVVAAASIGSAHMAIANTRQTGEHSLVPPPAQMLLDDEVEEIEEIEPDLPDFVPSSTEVAGMLMRARTSNPTPLFDPPPRAVSMPSAATSFSAAEAAFFAAGEEMDTIDMDPEQDTFDDLPGVERQSFWSRLKNRASAGH